MRDTPNDPRCTVSVSLGARLPYMARAPGRGGRHTKGPRTQLMTRTPVELAESVKDEAERLGLTFSDYIANLLAKEHGFPPIAVPKENGESQMKLTA